MSLVDREDVPEAKSSRSTSAVLRARDRARANRSRPSRIGSPAKVGSAREDSASDAIQLARTEGLASSRPARILPPSPPPHDKNVEGLVLAALQCLDLPLPRRGWAANVQVQRAVARLHGRVHPDSAAPYPNSRCQASQRHHGGATDPRALDERAACVGARKPKSRPGEAQPGRCCLPAVRLMTATRAPRPANSEKTGALSHVRTRRVLAF